MKTLLTYFAACAMAVAGSLKPGDAVKPDAIGAATFIKGEAPKEWEQDKLYILECWATWCGPCVAAIPHMNELYTEFKDKGLRVFGMNVWEDNQTEVEEFVKAKGEGMSYPVAFAGMEGPFIGEWLKAAGVNGIPHAFVVKNGKLLFSCHPVELTKEVVTDLLAGGEKEAAIVKEKQAAAAKAAEEDAKAEAESAARQERLGDFEEQLSKLGQAEDHEGALKLVKTTLAENTKLTVEDKQQLTFVTAMIYAEMKKLDEALKALDEAKAIAPESEMGKHVEEIKAQVKEHMSAQPATEGGKEEAAEGK
ncbi:MAG: TlpA family protein disulfide reductase [Akkermansiaceae bacterium]|nr:TlpA family protein disulfide reductase [Akkermansiaceae bacterium]